jgi:hypothetical protein
MIRISFPETVEVPSIPRPPAGRSPGSAGGHRSPLVATVYQMGEVVEPVRRLVYDAGVEKPWKDPEKRTLR